MRAAGLALVVMAVGALAAPPRESLAGQDFPFPAPPRQARADGAEPEPFVLGVLRRDRIVSPFASFDGKQWSSPWPEDLRFMELPISLESISGKWWGKAGAPTELTIWDNGTRKGTLRLTRPTMLPIMCGRRLALLSSYEPSEPAPPWGVQPYPKDGLVVSGRQPIEPIETVPRTAPEWASMAVTLLEPFDASETLAIKGFTAWKHPVAPAARRKVPIELETWYRAAMDTPGWIANHVEAVRRYRPGPADEDCGLVTYVSGWVMMGPDHQVRLQIGAQVTYCDRRDNTFMLPLGLLKQGGRTYWVYQMSGYGREGYTVNRPMPKRNEPQVVYTAGACF